jgi:hypothetical protein
MSGVPENVIKGKQQKMRISKQRELLNWQENEVYCEIRRWRNKMVHE